MIIHYQTARQIHIRSIIWQHLHSISFPPIFIVWIAMCTELSSCGGAVLCQQHIRTHSHKLRCNVQLAVRRCCSADNWILFYCLCLGGGDGEWQHSNFTDTGFPSIVIFQWRIPYSWASKLEKMRVRKDSHFPLWLSAAEVPTGNALNKTCFLFCFFAILLCVEFCFPLPPVS